MNEIMHMQLTRGGASAILEKHFNLSWCSSAIDYGMVWCLGRGIWMLDIARKLRGEQVDVIIKGCVQGGPLRLSGVAEIGTLLSNDMIPKRCPDSWVSAKGDQTIITMCHPKSSATIQDLAYGTADIATGMFLKGAENLKFQLTGDLAQVWCDLGMKQEEFCTYLSAPQDYTPGNTVGDFPWR